LDAHELLEGYRRREFSPSEVVASLSERIESTDGDVNAFTTLDLEQATDAAEAATRAYAGAGASTARPLEGLPLAVKDLFDTEGIRTTYGSAMFSEHVPTADAKAVSLAKEAGCIVIGKTTTHEFGWGITSANPHYGDVRNPWNLDCTPGGSSGGSAAALALGAVPLALGSDTGGSIRIPASFCGVVGFKPTFARVPVAGAFPLAFSLDHAGPMARTPRDALLLLRAIAPGRWEHADGRDDGRGRGSRFAGARVGVLSDTDGMRLSSDIERVFQDALETLAGLGAECVECHLPEAADMLATFGTIQRAEAVLAHRLAGIYPSRGPDYGADVRARLEVALGVTLDDYLKAALERRRLQERFLELLASVDVLISPISAVPPVPVGEDDLVHEGETVPFRDAVMTYTVPQDLVGVPACAVRAGFDRNGVPVGVQLTGMPWSDEQTLLFADAFFATTESVQGTWPQHIAATPPA
jgi:aspartyl-tRNA(Asn)/glutamyl-tRNA(Gln) amidotransferase subunit A